MAKEEVIVIEVVDQEAKLKTDTTNISIMVKETSIKNDDDYAIAQVLGKAANEIIKKIKEHFAPIKKSTYQAHKDANALEKSLLKSPEESKASLKKLMITYEEEQEAIRVKAENKIKAELQAKIDAQPKIEQEAGIVAEEEIGIADVSVKSTFQTAGSTTDHWKAEVKDFPKFLMAVVKSGRVELLTVNQPALNAYAKETEGKTPFDGVEFRNDKVKKF